MHNSLIPTLPHSNSGSCKEFIPSLVQSFFLSLSPDTPIKQAIQRMSEEKVDFVLVIENEQLEGIFTERDLIKITRTQALLDQSTLGEWMTTNLIKLQETEIEDLFSLFRILKKHRIRHLPVVNENNHAIGVITPQSLRNCLQPEHLLRFIRTEEVIQTSVIDGAPDTSLLQIVEKMSTHSVSCIVIVRPGTLYPIGIITERDIVRYHALNLDFVHTQADSVMSQPLHTINTQTTLWETHQQMHQLKTRHLVVVHSNQTLAGIITQTQILKFLDPAEMIQVMQQMQKVIDQQTETLRWLNQELLYKNKELTRLSMVDELTQVVNRNKLNPFLEETWKSLSHLQQPISIIMCDIDYFKQYNDTYGHLAGDQCLTTIAQTIRSVTRDSTDLVARYGGEEFIVVLPNVQSCIAERVAKTILEKVRTLRIPHVGSEVSDVVTLSLGVLTIIPTPSQSPAMVLDRVDKLLYQAKGRGRNTYVAQEVCQPQIQP